MRNYIGLSGGIVALVVGWSPGFVTGCGGGAGTDLVDAGDASTTEDASFIPDGGPGIDQDQDGYPVDQDCNDQDPSVYPGTVEGCSSNCFDGERGCLADGSWSTCSARTDCDCTMPGDTRVVECGSCGQSSQTCQPDGHWSFPGECHGEGACLPGQEESQPCEHCGGAETRLCDMDCQWLPWQGCSGVCTPGLVERGPEGCGEPYEIQERECDTSCQWVATLPCTSNCLVQPRTGTPDFKDEVCVQGSNFVMGSLPGERYPNEEPQHVLAITPFLIDVYEVTNDRYRECVTAGVCTEPPAWSYYHLADHGGNGVDGVTYGQAQSFCQWDQGRELPSEAQWEKAARGPAPRTVSDPWGDTPPTCAEVAIRDCLPNVGPYAVDLCPAGISYYGLYNQASNAREWVADWYDAGYYAVSPTTDPTGPATGQERVIRGMGYDPILESYHHTATLRYSLDPASTTGDLGLRCARTGY